MLLKQSDSWNNLVIFPKISILIFIFLNFCPSGMKTMDRKTGKRVRQVVLLNRGESPQERKNFLDNLSRNSKFQNLLGRLYPSNQDSKNVSIRTSIHRTKNLLGRLYPSNQRTTNHSIRFPCRKTDPLATQATLLMPMIYLISTQLQLQHV